MLEKNKIHLGDCFELLNEVENSSIDLLLTDPPYNISVKDKISSDGKIIYNSKPHSKTSLNIGEWDFDFDIENWLRVVSPKIKDDGQMIIFTGFNNVELISRVLEQEGFTVMPTMNYWYKTNPVPQHPKRLPQSSIEQFIWAVKNPDKYTFNIREGKEFELPRFEHSSHELKQERFHPTQKPLELFKKLVQIHSNQGDLVLDTCSGSGTTIIGCNLLKRDCIAIEKNEEYYSLSTKRFKKYKKKVKNLWD